MELNDTLKIKIRNEIIMTAKIKHTVEYTTLQLVAGSKDIGIDIIDSYLREISIEDFNEGKPVLWAIVRQPGKQFPSDGFFNLIAELKIVPKITDINRQQEYDKLVSTVFDYWSKRRKTGKRKY